MKNIWPKKCLAKPSRSLFQHAILAVYMRNQLRFSSSKYFRFYWTKKHFISEWYFTNHEIGSVVRKAIKSWDTRQNRDCLSPRWVKNLQEFINFCLKVGHSANLKHSKSTWRQSSCDSCKKYKISTSRNGNDLRQLSFWYRALSCGSVWFTTGVYIWVAHLHIAVPTITCSLRYA